MLLEALFSELYAGVRALVHIVTARLELEDFLRLISRHKAVLSPPGRGYDCCRTWQAVAVGTVPLVVNDAAFDQRLHMGLGPQYAILLMTDSMLVHRCSIVIQ